MNRMYIDNSFNTNKQSSKNFKNIQKILDDHAKWQIRDFSISDIEATVNKKNDGVKYFVVDIKKEIIQCYNKFENKKQKDGFYEYYNKIK